MKKNENAVLEVKNIHKYFPGVHALKGVNFKLQAGEVHALVGENGAGKSTLIKIIAGVYKPEEGEYLLNGESAEVQNPADSISKGVSVIYQELNSAPSLSIAENIFFGRLPQRYGKVQWQYLYEEAAQYMKEVGLNMDPRTKVGYLSIAQQQLVEIAKAISINAKVIIMDEPTSALSPAEVKSLFRVIKKLKEKGVGIIYISHKLDEIFTVSDRITVFRDGAVVGEAKTGTIDNDTLIGMMVGRKMEDVFPPKTRQPGEIVLDVKNLSTDKVENLNFQIRRGEIVGFSGLMGAGRTEMTKAIFGLDKRYTGEIYLEDMMIPKDNPIAARKMGIGLVSENRKEQGIIPNMSVGKNITLVTLNQVASKAVINKNKEADAITKIVKKILIKTPSFSQLITKLSGGNQQKVMLARWLVKENLKLLIIDEPTRGIDVGAKAEIYALMDSLARQGLAILMVSSELPEILGMCDRIYVMRDGKITGEFNADEATEKILLSKAIN